MTSIPTPWNFHNTDKRLLSPDGQHKLIYYHLNEIAMGAPLGGTCFLEGDGIKLKIHDWCGGPPVWHNEGNLLAISIWERTSKDGTSQKIGIIDLEHLELKIFEKTFRVLDLRAFEGNIVSIISNNETFSFDTKRETVETVIKLKS